jgi:hypothetical protein
MDLFQNNSVGQQNPNVQLQDISSQRKLADQLRQQGAEQLQGQNVSGIYVAPSWTQQLAKVLQSGLGSYYEADASKKENQYAADKAQKFAAILAGNKPQQVAGTPVDTTSMPAYTPDQQDQFGSPLPDVQRTPVTTTTAPMTQETPDQQMQRVQPQVLSYMQQYGNTPEGQYLLNQLGKQDDRSYQQGVQKADWAHQDANYARDLGDKRTDMATQNQYQTDSQGRVFAHEDTTNAGNHAFTTSERLGGQQFTAGQNVAKNAFELRMADAKQEDAPILTPDALDSAARTYRMTGTIPPLGQGKAASALRSAIINKAGELDKADGKTGEQSAIDRITGKSNTSALNQLQKQRTMISAFEKNAQLNGDMALKLSDQVDRTGVPILNQWLQAGQKNITGNPAVSQFHAANETFVNEYAKIMSGSMGNTAVSDSARAHAHSLLSTAQTKDQYKAIMGTLNQEMNNRMAGLDQELAASKDSFKGTQPSAPNTQGWKIEVAK